VHEHGSLPRARRDGLLEETLDEELLLYDQDSHTAHCLSPIAACVWRHCDGERDVTELAELTQSTVPSVSRREAIVRVARYGAAVAGASMIVSATAATPAMASSGEEYEPCMKEPNGSTNCCVCWNGSYSSSKKTREKCIAYCVEERLMHTWLKGWVCK
jgi:DNA-binding transcriptional LysR family regulator